MSKHLKKTHLEIIQAIDNSNRVIYLQELVAMMVEQLEMNPEGEVRQARLDLLLDSYREQIAPELEELRSHLAAARLNLESLVLTLELSV
jgi:homoserine kinase